MDDIHLHHRISQEAPEPLYLDAGFRPKQSPTQLAPQKAYTQGSLSRQQSLLSHTPLHKISPIVTAAHKMWRWPNTTASQFEGQSYVPMCQQQSRLNYNKRVHTIHTRDTSGAPRACDQRHRTTGLHRAPITQDHLTKSLRHSRYTMFPPK